MIMQDTKSSQVDGFKPSSDDGKKVDEDPSKGSEFNDQEKEENVNSTSTNNVNTVSSTVNVAGTNRVNVVGENTNSEVLFDLDMLALEYISTFNFLSDHENDGEVADMNNLDTTIQKFRFTKVKNASTPMETQKPLLKDEDGKEVDVHMYRYQVNLNVSHLHAVKRIFRYLKGQPKPGLWYPKDSPFDLVSYTDSDYAGASLDRMSTTGGC
nr:hypothetical protein [Tanacetum cinerariifolium]